MRSVSHKELAMRYFPYSTPAAARAHLTAWIQGCPELKKKLEATGYRSRQKDLTPLQYGTIIDYLGEP